MALQHRVGTRLHREVDVLADRLGDSAIASITSGVKSWGCGLVNRIAADASTALTCRKSSANSGRVGRAGTETSRPYVLTFCPSRVTSTTPRAARPCTSARMSPIGARALGPAHERHDAERARVVAPGRDRDPRTERRRASRRAARSGTSRCTRGRPSAGPSTSDRSAGRAGAAARGCRPRRRPRAPSAGSGPGPSARGSPHHDPQLGVRAPSAGLR